MAINVSSEALTIGSTWTDIEFGAFSLRLSGQLVTHAVSAADTIMSKHKKLLSPKYQIWVDARTRFSLSHAQIQMARELGLNPKKFGKLANHKQEPWKEPLPNFIETLYFKRFKKHKPDNVRPIEQIVRDKKSTRADSKECKRVQSAFGAEEKATDSEISPG